VDEARADRIGDEPEHDRNGASYLPQRRNGRTARDKDYIRCQRHQFGGVFARIVNIASAPAVLDLNVVPDSPAQLLQSLQERRVAGLRLRIVRGVGHEHADAPHPLTLLRARRERPAGRSTAKQRDERAAVHSITSSARASSIGGISRPSALAVTRLMTGSTLTR